MLPAAVPDRAAALRTRPPGGWAPPGRLVELCAGPDGARTTVAALALCEAQAEGDPVAWVLPRDGGAGPFPPDLRAAGVDLDALLVVHVPHETVAAARAAEIVLRTGAFGAVVLDLSASREGLLRASWQGRLLALAREHSSRLVVLAPADREGLGSLVSLRWGVRRARACPERYRIEGTVIKDKSGGQRDVTVLAAGPE